jgi:hypothetical protein
MAKRKQSPQEQLKGGIFMILFGAIIPAAVLTVAGREAWHAAWSWVAYHPTEAVVGERRLVEDGTSRGHPVYRLETWLTYQADGQEYQGWVRWGQDAETYALTGKAAEALLNRVQPGDRVTCYYSRFDPGTALIDRGNGSMLWVMLFGVVAPGVWLIVGIRLVATRWRQVWPPSVRTEARDMRQRLPRRFYVMAGAVLVCVATVVLAFVFLGFKGILFLIPAVAVAIPCFYGAVNIVQRMAFPSPEKLAAVAAATSESAAAPTPAAAVNEFFASLESPSAGQVADLPSLGRSATCPKASAAWNRADAVAVTRGEHLPVRLKTNPFDSNKGKIGISLYLLFMLFIVLVGLAILPLRAAAAHGAQPDPGAWVKLPVAVAIAGVVGTLVWIGWRRYQRLSGVVVEVSAHPFPAGHSLDVAVSHADPRAVERLRLELLCEEDAYTGTHKGRPQTETRRVLRQPVPLDTPADLGDVRRGQIDVPPAPGSFSLRLHRVRWCLQARLGFWALRYPVKVQERPLEAGDLAPPAGERPSNRVELGVVSLWLDGDTNIFLPGATMTGGYHVRTHPDAVPLRRTEFSVVWWAAKPRPQAFAGFNLNRVGSARDSPDMGVCHFEEHQAAEDGALDLGAPRQFRVVLPDGPPSFHGKSFEIKWTVRLRVSYADSDQSVCDLPIVLARPISSCPGDLS